MPSSPPRLPTTIAGVCSICDGVRVFDVLRAEPIPMEDGSWVTQSYFSKCKDCEVTAVFEQCDFGDDEDLGTIDRVYPANPRELHFQMPAVVRQYYNDAVKVEAAGAWLSCVMTVRALLEAALKHFAPEAKTIEKAIEKLKDDGILSSDLIAWATELRLTGNLVVHVKQTHIQRDEAVELFDFAQAIIEVLYDLKPKFERLKARRQRP